MKFICAIIIAENNIIKVLFFFETYFYFYFSELEV